MFSLSSNPFAQQLYAWRCTWRAICQQKITSLLIILVIGLSLALPTTGYILWKNAHYLQQSRAVTGQITLFLQADISHKNKEKLLAKLKQDNRFEDVVYRSAKVSLSFGKFRKLKIILLGKRISLSQLSSESSWALFSSLRFSFAELRQHLRQLKGVENVQLDENFLQKVIALKQLLSNIIFALLTLTMLSILLIIINSLRAEVYRQHKSIEIMQLLGATKTFILQPFLLQGSVLLLLGAVLACVVSVATISHFKQQIQMIIPLFHSQYELQNMTLSEGLLLIILCAMLGYIITWITTNRAIQQLHNNKH